MSAGESHSLFWTNTGTLLGCGSNKNGQLSSCKNDQNKNGNEENANNNGHSGNEDEQLLSNKNNLRLSSLQILDLNLESDKNKIDSIIYYCLMAACGQSHSVLLGV